MKASLKFFSTFLLSFVFSITSKSPNFIDPPFLSPSKFIQEKLQIDYIFDPKSGFDEVSRQFLTELLENSIQVVSYLLEEVPATLSPTISSKQFCPQLESLTPSQMPPSDIVLLIMDDKNLKNPLSFEDCSSALYPQKLGLIKINMPLLLVENDNSTIYAIVESLSKIYLENSEILEKLDELFNSNLGASCTIACKVCNTNTGSCTTCYDATHMKIKNGVCYCSDPNAIFFSPTNSCVCKNGYYLNSTQLCAPCPAICASCSSLTSCLSCISPAQMTLYNDWCYCSSPEGSVFNSTLKNCNCPDDAWTDGNVCQTCNATCSSCIDQDTCTSCSDSANMNLNDGVCSCKDPNATFNETSKLCKCEEGYYMENSICYACQPPCETCSNSTFCDSCIISSMPLIDGNCTCPENTTFSKSEDRCVCEIGMFLNSDQVCESCLPECATCNDTSSCLTCIDPDAMNIVNGICQCDFPGGSFNTTTRKCTCSSGQFRDGSNCIPCSDQGCSVCTNETNCILCYPKYASYLYYSYVLVNGVCECQVPNSIPAGWQGCVCAQGYYESPYGAQCLTCPNTCISCTYNMGNPAGNYMNCNTCVDPSMIITSIGYCQCPTNSKYIASSKSCQCSQGYYMYGQSCTPCSLPCGNCTNSNICTSCAIPNQMTLSGGTCICTNPINSIYNSDLNQCICPERTYLDGTSCDECGETCMSCESSTECISCIDPAHMTLESNGTCTCPAGTIFNGDTCACDDNYFSEGSECIKCEPPCNQCTDQTHCLSCLDPNNMYISEYGECVCKDPQAYFDDLEKICICNDGYFMRNSACFSCPDTCRTCEDNENCTSCVDEYHMNLDNGTCSCSDTNSSFSSNRSMCVCNQGYQYLDNVCIECPVECSECSDSNICIECENPEEMSIISSMCVCNKNNTVYDPSTNSCICGPQYYYDGDECVVCQSPMCDMCENDRCLSCIDPINMTLESGICYCSDPNSIFNTSSGRCQCSSNYLSNLIGNALHCIPISSPCREFSVDGLCLKCADNSMQLYEGQCYCLDPNTAYNTNNQNCTCNFGYQLTSYSKLCQPCDSYLNGGIMGCINCNNGQCLECQENMVLSDGDCICKSGFVLDNILGTCVCAPGFWNSTECPPCECYSCFSNGTCLEPCTQDSTWDNGVCSCNSGFYQCGANQCCSLDTTCSTWNANNCVGCKGNMYMSRSGTADAQCYCKDGSIYSPEVNDCVCPQGEYFVSNYICENCGSYCNNCTSDGECISCKAPFFLQNGSCACDPNAIQSWNNCICKDGYYTDSDYSCLPCPEHCATCISSTTCTSCNGDLLLVHNKCLCSDINAVYNIEAGQCKCATGYYSKGSKCLACLASCYNCQNDGTTCISCADRVNMVLNDGVCSCADPNAAFNSTTLKCECPNGYYNGVCSACGPSCSQCSNNRCQSCYDSAHMALVGNSCVCLDPNSYFVEWAKICTCNSGFYYNGQICAPFPGLMFNKQIK